MKRTGLYLVRRDAWYVERAVWLVFGAYLLVATALAAAFHPLIILVATISGVASVMVGVTGVCAVGTGLLALGYAPRLGNAEAMPRLGPVRVYRLDTDRWFLERYIYVIVGANMILGSSMVWLHHTAWLWFTAFVGAASVVFAYSGFCIIANGLWRLGYEPRLGPDAPAREACSQGACVLAETSR